MVGDENPVGETSPLKLMIPEKLLMGVKYIEMLAPVPNFARTGSARVAFGSLADFPAAESDHGWSPG